MGESEIGVIKTWVSTYFVIGAWENVFCKLTAAQKAPRMPRRSNFVHAFQWVGRFRGTPVVLRIVQRPNASLIRFEAQLSQRNWLPD